MSDTEKSRGVCHPLKWEDLAQLCLEPLVTKQPDPPESVPLAPPSGLHRCSCSQRWRMRGEQEDAGACGRDGGGPSASSRNPGN